MNSHEVKKHNAEIDSVVKSVVNKSLSFNNSIEKLIYIHDYLVENIEYSVEENQTINNLYGALVLKKRCALVMHRRFAKLQKRQELKPMLFQAKSFSMPGIW